MLPNYEKEIQDEIIILERQYLEVIHPSMFPLSLDGYAMIRLGGMAKFWEDGKQPPIWQLMTDFVTGAWQNEDAAHIVLLGTPLDVHVYLASGKPENTQQILTGILPRAVLNSSPVYDLGSRAALHFSQMGVLSGIPHVPESNEPVLRSALDRVIRGMHDTTWGYVVQAFPLKRDDLLAQRKQVLEKLSIYASLRRHSLQETEQSGTQLTKEISASQTRVISGELVNWRAEHLVKLLETQLARLDEMLTIGGWQVAVTLGAASEDALGRLVGLTSGLYNGERSHPEPIRGYRCQHHGDPSNEFHTHLHSREAAMYFQLPSEEIAGFAIHDYVGFDVDYMPTAASQVDLGEILHDQRASGHTYGIPMDDLTKHGVVVGVTGSGKTTTIMSMLESLQRGGLPFLIIEPAKTEYRVLLGEVRGGRPTGAIPNLRVYTLGSETIAPFRLNPFEFETDDTPGSVSLLSHIDYLKAVFNAAFILYAPMPYVLEMALHEVYEDKGWELSTGINLRITDAQWEYRHRYPIFPTLTDLYNKIEDVVRLLRYDSRIEQDVQAGLKARLGALRLGSKGLMLDTARGIPMHDLLSVPTLLEMENIGNDDEKTFLIGLLLMRLYQYRRIQSANGKLPGGLQHLMVIEEAHRLLANTSLQVQTEAANPRAQAVETFINMLSEIRAYGQGVLVAEQIPSKLTPDIIKNTNLKIVHRILSYEDREVLAHTMNMNEEQMRHLTILPAGVAALHAQGADHPYLVRFSDLRQRLSLLPLTDRQLRDYAPTYINLEETYNVNNLFSYGMRRSSLGSPSPLAYQTAAKLLQLSGHMLWMSLLLRLRFERGKLSESMDEIYQLFATHANALSQYEHDQGVLLFVVQGASSILLHIGAENGWQYELIDDLRQTLTEGLITFLKTHNGAAPALDRFVRKYEQNLDRRRGPFIGCVLCRAVCHYRAEVQHLIVPRDVDAARMELANPDYQTQLQRYKALSQLLLHIVKPSLGVSNHIAAEVSYCVGMHLGNDLELSAGHQQEYARQLEPHLLT